MGARHALVTGTVASLAVTAAWSWSAALTIGPATVPDLTGDLPGDYAQIAAAATGSSPWALFAAVAVTYALCLLTSGWRRMRNERNA